MSDAAYKPHKCLATIVAVLLGTATMTHAKPVKTEFTFVGSGPANGMIYQSTLGGASQVLRITRELCQQIDASRDIAVSTWKDRNLGQVPAQIEFECMNETEFRADSRTKDQKRATSTMFNR